MTRFGAFVLVAVMAAAGGCAAPAKYVEKNANDGIVAVPDDTDCWPGYHRRAALEKITQHVGPNYEIVSERRVVTGQTTTGNGQSTTTDHTLNPKNPARPAQQWQTTTGTSTAMTQDVTQWQITYRRKDTPAASGLQPAGGAPANPLVPDVRPISAFNRPAAPGGAADCDH